MRRLVRFACDDATLSGSLDEGAATIGLLCVTGGSQVRHGPHRMLHRIAASIAAAGFAVFRYERRGVGDSDGDDLGYRESGPDLAAAARAFRAEAPHLRTIVGFGLCDGATTLALHGKAAGIEALILANPWLVDTGDEGIAPAAARAHYKRRILSPAAWFPVLTGKVNVMGAIRSLAGAVSAPATGSLADEVAGALAAYRGRISLVLAERDNTAIAAKACWTSEAFAPFAGERVLAVATNAHTFARSGDLEPVVAEVLAFMRIVEARG